MEKLEGQIRHLIIEALNLEDITPDEIDPNEQLFGEGLGLDSIDALEIGIELQKMFDIKIDADDGDLAEHFFSVRKLAQFVVAQKASK